MPEMTKVNRERFISRISKQTGLNQDLVRTMLGVGSDHIVDALAMGGRVEIRDLGSLKSTITRDVQVINPKTQERSIKDCSLRLHFKPSKSVTVIHG